MQFIRVYTKRFNYHKIGKVQHSYFVITFKVKYILR